MKLGLSVSGVPLLPSLHQPRSRVSAVVNSDVRNSWLETARNRGMKEVVNSPTFSRTERKGKYSRFIHLLGHNFMFPMHKNSRFAHKMGKGWKKSFTRLLLYYFYSFPFEEWGYWEYEKPATLQEEWIHFLPHESNRNQFQFHLFCFCWSYYCWSGNGTGREWNENEMTIPAPEWVNFMLWKKFKESRLVCWLRVGFNPGSYGKYSMHIKKSPVALHADGHHQQDPSPWFWLWWPSRSAPLGLHETTISRLGFEDSDLEFRNYPFPLPRFSPPVSLMSERIHSGREMMVIYP